MHLLYFDCALDVVRFLHAFKDEEAAKLLGWDSTRRLPGPSTSAASFPSVTTARPYSLSSATQKETKHDICFLHAASAPSCPSFSEKP